MKYQAKSWEKGYTTVGICRSHYHFFAFLNYQDSDAKIKIHQISTDSSSWIREVLLELLMEEFKLVVVQKYGFEKLAVITLNDFGILGNSRIGNEKRLLVLRAAF